MHELKRILLNADNPAETLKQLIDEYKFKSALLSSLPCELQKIDLSNGILINMILDRVGIEISNEAAQENIDIMKHSNTSKALSIEFMRVDVIQELIRLLEE